MQADRVEHRGLKAGMPLGNQGVEVAIHHASTTPPATCDIRFSLQDRYANQKLEAALTNRGISNRAVTISGHATMSEREIGEPEFVGAHAAEIRTRLTKYLEKHETIPRAHDLVILDMEPEGIAPLDLGTFEAEPLRQRKLISAYAQRIRVARQVFRRTKVPGLRLGLYQIIVPDGKGKSSKKFEMRMCGYVEAGKQGMYDELDFICPVLYQRFGSKDATSDTLQQWIGDATRQGINRSLDLTRRNGSRIPLVPLLSFWVFNGGSKSNRKAVSPVNVARQLKIVQSATGVEAIVFWSAWQTRHEMETPDKPVQAISIVDFLTDTGTLPWPGCT
jgi:hypothetical protein